MYIFKVEYVEILRDREVLDSEEQSVGVYQKKKKKFRNLKTKDEYTGVYGKLSIFLFLIYLMYILGFVYFKTQKDLENALSPPVRLFGLQIKVICVNLFIFATETFIISIVNW